MAVANNLARYLGEIKGPKLWLWAAAGDAENVDVGGGPSGGAVFVLGAEGKGLRPLVRRTCDDAVKIPLFREGGVAERQRGRGAAALRGEAAAWLSRRCTSSTATTCCTRATFEEPRELVDRLASFVALQRRAGRGRLRRRRRGADARAARGALRGERRRAARTPGRRESRRRDGLPGVVGLGGPGHLRAGGAKRSSKNFRTTSTSRCTSEPGPASSGDRVDDETRKRLEKLRRGQGSG